MKCERVISNVKTNDEDNFKNIFWFISSGLLMIKNKEIFQEQKKQKMKIMKAIGELRH